MMFHEKNITYLNTRLSKWYHFAHGMDINVHLNVFDMKVMGNFCWFVQQVIHGDFGEDCLNI